MLESWLTAGAVSRRSIASALAWAIYHTQKHETDHDSEPRIAWKRLASRALANIAFVLWVLAIFLFAQLINWGFNAALRPIDMDAFSTILGMVFISVARWLLSLLCGKTMDEVEKTYIKPKIDFISKNMALGFAVPLAAMRTEETLNRTEIGKVIGNFVMTNVIFWPVVFIGTLMLGICLGLGLQRLVQMSSRNQVDSSPEAAMNSSGTGTKSRQITLPHSDPASKIQSTPRIEIGPPTPDQTAEDFITIQEFLQDDKKYSGSTLVSLPPKTNTVEPKPNEENIAFWEEFAYQWSPILLPILLLLVLGIPLSTVADYDTALDICVFWMIWVTSTTLQSMLLRQAWTSLATLLNGVLLTTLGMIAYIQAKSAATSTPVDTTVSTFYSGISLADLASYAVSPGQYPIRSHHYGEGTPLVFGAGDAAIALLEAGMVLWGIKLYHCRRQLFSLAGFAVAVASTLVAGANVFVAPILGRFAVGLGPQEAAAFAARSVTLPLAREAVQAVDGNEVVNAALVVSNGILGQLLYPFVLDKVLGKKNKRVRDVESTSEGESQSPPDGEVEDSGKIVAAGATIGINGAAMGVTYLYGIDSRAAPYAALSMTVFGVMTVVFTAVEPFTGGLKALVW